MVFKSQNLGLKISSNTNTKKKKKRRSQTYEDATAPIFCFHLGVTDAMETAEREM